MEAASLRRSIAWVLALLAACGGPGAPPEVAEVRDSAGVRIVTRAAPAWGDEAPWRVEPRPAVEIGTLDGPAENQLSEMRGAIRLGDGGIVVAVADPVELRFYDAEGAFVRRAGRAGGGPGEFQTLDGIVAYRGDSVAAWDARSRRLSVFAADGTFGRATTLEEATGVVSWLRGSFPDGSIVVEPAGALESFLRMQSGERRDTAVYLRFTVEGRLADTLARLPDREIVVSRDGGVISQETVLFGRDSYLATGGGRAYAGASDAFRVDVLAPGGATLASIRRTEPARAVRRGELERARAAAEARREATAARIARITASPPPRSGASAALPARATVPAFSQLLVDAEGYLWVAEYRVDEEAPGRWQVFDADGAWLGTVETPAGLTVEQIGRDWVLGRSRDALDVESVRLHRLLRR